MTLSQLPALSVKVMEIQTNADPTVFWTQGASVLNFQSNGNSNKRRRDHWYSEDKPGHRSRRLPSCVSRRIEEARHCRFGVGGAPEEQSRGTQEQIVAVEVTSTMDEG